MLKSIYSGSHLVESTKVFYFLIGTFKIIMDIEIITERIGNIKAEATDKEVRIIAKIPKDNSGAFPFWKFMTAMIDNELSDYFIEVIANKYDVLTMVNLAVYSEKSKEVKEDDKTSKK